MSLEVYVILLVLAIPTYFLIVWGMKKTGVGNSANRRYIALLPTVLLTPLIYVGLIMLWFFSASYYSEQDFDKAKWNADVEERYRMSEDIIDSKILIGKTKEEVVDLLGEDYYTYSDDHISYYLGFVPGLLNIDPDVLDIYFKDNRVVKVGQHRT